MGALRMFSGHLGHGSRALLVLTLICAICGGCSVRVQTGDAAMTEAYRRAVSTQVSAYNVANNVGQKECLDVSITDSCIEAVEAFCVTVDDFERAMGQQPVPRGLREQHADLLVALDAFQSDCSNAVATANSRQVTQFLAAVESFRREHERLRVVTDDLLGRQVPSESESRA